jgi:hypothetical protein
MQLLKIFGLGTMFLFVIIAAHGIVGALLGKTQVSTHTAVGLSALTAGTVYNPYFWLTIVVAYGAATLVCRRTFSN